MIQNLLPTSHCKENTLSAQYLLFTKVANDQMHFIHNALSYLTRWIQLSLLSFGQQPFNRFFLFPTWLNLERKIAKAADQLKCAEEKTYLFMDMKSYVIPLQFILPRVLNSFFSR